MPDQIHFNLNQKISRNRIRQRNHLSGKTGYSFTSASTRKNDTYNLFSDESDADDVIYNKPKTRSDSSTESVVGGFEKIGKAFGKSTYLQIKWHLFEAKSQVVVFFETFTFSFTIL